MKKHGYSLMDNHVNQHNSFIVGFNKILKENNLNDADKSNALVSSLLGWFSDHILTADKYFATFILKYER